MDDLVLVNHLRKLSDTIWEASYSSGHPNTKWMIESRNLTEDEWTLVFEAMQHMVVVPHNACMGFGLGVTLYSHPQQPGMTPERVITVTGDHMGDRVTFQQAWDKFSPYFTTNQNQMWLELYGFGKIREQSYYDY